MLQPKVLGWGGGGHWEGGLSPKLHKEEGAFPSFSPRWRLLTVYKHEHALTFTGANYSFFFKLGSF